MENALKFYINGKWVAPSTKTTLDVINPATEESIAKIAMGGKADVDKAVAAAKTAFATFSKTTVEERIALLERIIAAYQARMGDIAQTVSQEMGAPIGLASAAQAPAGLGHLMNSLKASEVVQMVGRCGHRPCRARADRCLRSDYALELAAESDRRQGGSGDCCRLHDDSEAFGDRSAERHHLCGSDGCCGCTGRRIQPDQW